MKNIFVVGSEVSGESQIGYQRYIDKFTDILTNTVNNISIIGLKRFGKTSIAKEVLSRVKSNCNGTVVVLFIDLAKQRSFSDFLISLKNNLEDEIMSDDKLGEEFITDPIFNRFMDKINSVDPESKTYRDTLESIFKRLTKKGCRVILSIDEFDAASDLFTETADFEFLRDLSSNRDIGLSLMLISRRQLYMIEKKNFNNSTFHGVVQTHPINGFNAEDLNQYYGILRDKYRIKISDYVKKRLNYYCGKSPYLLSMFAYEIVDDYQNDGTINIDQIYKRREIDIENYYKSIFACLNNDKVCIEGAFEEVSTVEKLVGVIVGPKINIVESDISLLKSMGYLSYEDSKYYSISNHFTNALRRVPISVDVWKAILELEKKIKTMIRKQILVNNNIEVIDYDKWTEIFDIIGAAATLDTYDRFIDDSMTDYSCDVDILDVCSLDIAVSILQFYWQAWFSKFFNNDPWDKWESQLRLCASARNPMAHGHEEFLSVEDKVLVNEYCVAILKMLSLNDACTDIKTELKLAENIKKAEARRRFYSLSYESVTQNLMGTTCIMTASEQNNKGIKGFITINDKHYMCSIGKNKWLAKYPTIALSSHIGNDYNVRISGVNESQNTLTLDFV